MATDIAPQRSGLAEQPPTDNYLTHSSGLSSWIFTLDHKRIGMMYLIGVTTALFLGGIFALVLRIELLTPGKTIISADTYNQMFTLHGAVMVFLFIIPGIPAALGNFVLPLMLGAKDVAFPRLNLFSFHLWVMGLCMFLLTLILGGLDTGWTFYAPYSVTTNTSVISALTGAFLLGFSSIFTGLNFIVTSHVLRPKGMNWFKLPLFIWALYATAIIQVLATPVLAITLLLLLVEKATGIGVFDPALGGDPVLFQHFFWFYSHPAVYIMVLPAMGVISELIAAFTHKRIFGYSFIAFSSVGIAVIGFLVWGHHMFTSGESKLVAMVFSGITFTVAIPSAIKVFNWVASLYKGSIRLATPMLYALSFLVLFSIGGLTGLHLATLSVDVYFHDTYFVVAHFHYVMVGSALTAMLGGLFYWWPKMVGRMYNETVGQISAGFVFVGFNMTFFPQFILGCQGMPRRYYNYLPEFQTWHQVSTCGALTLGVGIMLATGCLLHALLRGRIAPANPWGGTTLEWQCSSPPPFDNFKSPPPIHDPYDVDYIVYDEAIGGYVQRDDVPQAGARSQPESGSEG